MATAKSNKPEATQPKVDKQAVVEQSQGEAAASDAAEPVAEAAQPKVDDEGQATSQDNPEPDMSTKPDQVVVTIPKRFQVTMKDGKVLKFLPGVQKINREVAEHWYSKANGVTIFNAD